MHLTYRSRLVEYEARQPAEPSYFLKPPSTLNGHLGPIRRPRGARYLNYEGELAVVVGRQMSGVPAARVSEYVYGFAPANDVGLHDFRHADRGAMLRVKGQDGFLPIGPAVVTIDEWWPDDGYSLRTYLNGEVVQRGGSDDIIWDYRYQLADLCRLITLEPGDVVLTGTPANSRPMAPGDVVEVEIDGLGRLRTRSSTGTSTSRAPASSSPSRRTRCTSRSRSPRTRPSGGSPRGGSSHERDVRRDDHRRGARRRPVPDLRAAPARAAGGVRPGGQRVDADALGGGRARGLASRTCSPPRRPTSPVDLTFGSPTVLTCDGDVHKELRSSIDPKFRPRAVDTYVDALIEPIADAAARSLRRLEAPPS